MIRSPMAGGAQPRTAGQDAPIEDGAASAGKRRFAGEGQRLLARVCGAADRKPEYTTARASMIIEDHLDPLLTLLSILLSIACACPRLGRLNCARTIQIRMTSSMSNSNNGTS